VFDRKQTPPGVRRGAAVLAFQWIGSSSRDDAGSRDVRSGRWRPHMLLRRGCPRKRRPTDARRVRDDEQSSLKTLGPTSEKPDGGGQRTRDPVGATQ
jgi:hypothetical protein